MSAERRAKTGGDVPTGCGNFALRSALTTLR